MRNSSTPTLTYEPSDRPKLADRPFRFKAGTAIVRLTEAEVDSLKQDCTVALMEGDRAKRGGNA
mgnify:CR=1 FL=1